MVAFSPKHSGPVGPAEAVGASAATAEVNKSPVTTTTVCRITTPFARYRAFTQTFTDHERTCTTSKSVQEVIAHAEGRGLMNKQDLIAKIVRETRVSKRVAATMVATTLATITKSLKKGDVVTLVGFGTFKTAIRKARKGRNPLTGGAIRIPAGKPFASPQGNPSRRRSTSRSDILFVRPQVENR